MMRNSCLLALVLAVQLPIGVAFGDAGESTVFQRVTLSQSFYSEGANFADINGNGHMDIVSGPFWWEGPDFQRRHAYYQQEPIDPASYSEHFFTYTHDLNGSGYPDVLVIGFPGQEARWYENPGPEGHDSDWPVHIVFEVVDNESPMFADITGDGKPEIICSTEGAFGYLRVNWEKPTEPWTFHAISPPGPAGGRFTHGIGIGDVNGDGRMDLLEKNGWWEQPESREGDPLWQHHPFEFTPVGGAQMYAYDVNGDGRNDIITSLHAHAWGLAWFEQIDDGEGGITFRRHDIMTESPDDNPYGLAISQLHAIELADMNGDGVKEIVTGKRWWAHGGNDPGGDAPAVLYYFALERHENGEVTWVPHEIDDDSGVGTQLVVGDVSGNGLMDVVIGNKKGTFVHLQKRP
ncbi:MAG: VCBS repeat-containing protein [Phycisphaeraceae bacterium]